MKKLLALILIFALAVPAGGVAAKRTYKSLQKQYSTYDHDELLLAYQVISDILFKSAASKDGIKVPAGMYIVGKDIPAGDYRIDFPGVGEYTVGSFATFNSDGLVFSSNISAGEFGVNSIGKQILFDDMVVFISDVDAVFHIYTGLFN